MRQNGFLFMLLLALLLASQTSPWELLRTEIDVTSKIQSSECKIRRYGGKDKYWCDIAPAFKRALIECRDQADQSWDATKGSTCYLVVQPGTYYVGSTIQICGSNLIEFRGARLRSAKNSGAIRFRGFAECQSLGYSKPGLSDMSGLDIEPFAQASSATVAIFGVEAAAPVNLRTTKIYGYTQGIRIDAGATRVGILASLANRWHLDSVQVQESTHAGIFVDGSDANVGVGVGVSSTGSCKNATLINAARATAGLFPLGKCADVADQEFLGSSFLALHTGYAKDALGTVPPPNATPSQKAAAEADDVNFPGILLGEDANSRSVCIGCYAEAWSVPTATADNLAQKNTNVVGGIARWTSGPVIQGYTHAGFESLSPDGSLWLRAGVLTGGGALTLAPQSVGGVALPTGTQPLRFKYEIAQHAIRADVANVNTAIALRLGVGPLALGGLAGLVLEPTNAQKNVYLNNSGFILQRLVP